MCTSAYQYQWVLEVHMIHTPIRCFGGHVHGRLCHICPLCCSSFSRPSGVHRLQQSLNPGIRHQQQARHSTAPVCSRSSSQAPATQECMHNPHLPPIWVHSWFLRFWQRLQKPLQAADSMCLFSMRQPGQPHYPPRRARLSPCLSEQQHLISGMQHAYDAAAWPRCPPPGPHQHV